MIKTFFFVPLFAAVAAIFNTATADIYSTNFTTAENPGYLDGNAVNTIDGWSSQAGLVGANTGSNGEMQFSGNFLRGFNAINTPFAVGETLTLTASVKSIGGNNPGFDANILHFGLSSSTNLGTGTSQVGALLGAQGSLFRLDGAGGGATRTDSIAIDTAYHTLKSEITKSATTNQFDVVNTFGTTTISYTATDSALYGASGVNLIVYSQGHSNVGNIAIDSVSIATSAVPEPGSLALLGLGAIGFVARRRRKA